MSRVDDLIIVAGHAAFGADVQNCPANPELDKHWVLNPQFQLGEPPFYLEHIKSGLELVTARPNSLLLFSGGLTHPDTHWTEANTYLAIANSFAEYSEVEIWFRVALEEYARDSFENLLFGICRFEQLVGRQPITVTVVGWKFKSIRFKFHAETLGLEQFEYIGVNDPDDVTAAMAGEAKTTSLFLDDPLGRRGLLYEIRMSRSFGNRDHGYESTSKYAKWVAS